MASRGNRENSGSQSAQPALKGTTNDGQISSSNGAVNLPSNQEGELAPTAIRNMDHINDHGVLDLSGYNSNASNNNSSGPGGDTQVMPTTTTGFDEQRMMGKILTRIFKELEEFSVNPPDKCSAGLKNDDIREWTAVIFGPEGSVYEGGTFVLNIKLPKHYPFEAPIIKFLTPIYHCNIGKTGEIFTKMLQERWLPTLTISMILRTALNLLINCNLDYPTDIELEHQYRNNREFYDKTARDWTLKYAK